MFQLNLNKTHIRNKAKNTYIKYDIVTARTKLAMNSWI